MRRRTLLTVLAVVSLVGLPGPVSAAASPPGPTPTTHPPPLVTDAIAVPLRSATKPLEADTPLHLAFTLTSADPSGLAGFLAAVSDPGSAEYRHFLPYSDFLNRFGPSPSTVSAVETVLLGASAKNVALAPGGLAVDATLAAGAAEQLLGVHLVAFAAPAGGRGFTALGAPSLPPALKGQVSGVDGLSGGSVPSVDPTLVQETSAAPLRSSPALFVVNGTGAELFVGSDFAQAYEATDLIPGNHSVAGATYPSRVAVATILASGYNASTSTALPPWAFSVVDQYFNDTFPAGWPLPTLTAVRVNESGAVAPPLPGPLGGLNDSTGFEVENSLDLEMAGSLAPGASLYNFYVSGELLTNPATQGNAATYLADALGEALSYSYPASHLAVISCSFGLPDTNNSQWDAELEAAAATGVTVVAASGDEGNAPAPLTGRSQGQWMLWPATAAFNTSGVISVGGVTTVLSGGPTARFTSPPLVVRYDPNVTGISNITAWWNGSAGPGKYAGTEGGTSLLYPEPWWQFHSAAQPPIVNATVAEGFSRLGRAGPDVAFPANSTVVYVSPLSGSTPDYLVVGGTSIAAPVFAGLLADIVAVESQGKANVTGLGFLDPVLYRLGSYFRANPASAPSDPFLDVLAGGNWLFQAGPGWDAVTGWGGVYAPLLLTALSEPALVDYNYTGPTPVLPASGSPPAPWLTIAVIASGAVAALGAAYVLYTSRSRSRYDRPPAPPAGPGPPTPPAWSEPSPRTTATFACPYCGVERPAEAGRCPGCGAM